VTAKQRHNNCHSTPNTTRHNTVCRQPAAHSTRNTRQMRSTPVRRNSLINRVAFHGVWLCDLVVYALQTHNASNTSSSHLPIQTSHSYPTSVYLQSFIYLVSVQRPRSTRSSSVVTLARPPSSSSLKITDRSFRYASPCLWNQLPLSLCKPHFGTSSSISESPIPSPITSSSLIHHSVLPLSFTPGLKPISFTNPTPVVSLLPAGLPKSAFIDYCLDCFF